MYEHGARGIMPPPQERTYSVVADHDHKVVVCKATGAGIGLLNAMMSMAVHQSFVYAKPVCVLEDGKPFRVVEVRFPRNT